MILLLNGILITCQFRCYNEYILYFLLSGIQQSVMFYESKYWRVQSLRHDRYVLRQRHYRPDYPFGRTTWYECTKNKGQTSCDGNEESQNLLAFSSCIKGEFTCDSGHCVDDIGYSCGRVSIYVL